MPIYQKKLVDHFFEVIHADFEAYCIRQHIYPSNTTFLTYLYDLNLLDENAMRRYSILEEYEKLHALPSFKKTHTVRHLADRFNVSDRAVWNLIAGRGKR